MKTLPIITFLAALVALPLLPFTFEVAASILFAAGFAAILAADYTQKPRLEMAPIAPVFTIPPAAHREPASALELAA